MTLPSLAAKTAKALDLIGTGYELSARQRPAPHPLHVAGPAQEPGRSRSVALGRRRTGRAIGYHHQRRRRHARALQPRDRAAVPQLRARHSRAARRAAAVVANLLFWDDGAAEQPYTSLPLSYLARGLNAVAMRSDWGATATWASFRASAFVDYDGAWRTSLKKASFDAERGPGMVTRRRTVTPLLFNAVNTFGFIDSAFPGTRRPTRTTSMTSASAAAIRSHIYNAFYNGSRGQIAAPVDDTPAPRTRIARYEDGGSYVLVALADDHPDVYPSADGISGWTREVVYLRPNQFVVYDRTTVSRISDEQWTGTSSPRRRRKRRALGREQRDRRIYRRDDDGAAGRGRGHARQRLQRQQGVSARSAPASPAADMRWLTVFDTAASAAAVATATPLSASSNVSGALLKSSSGGNAAMLFGSVGDGERSGHLQRAGGGDAGSSSSDLAREHELRGERLPFPAATHAVTIQPGTGFTTERQGHARRLHHGGRRRRRVALIDLRFATTLQ